MDIVGTRDRHEGRSEDPPPHETDRRAAAVGRSHGHGHRALFLTYFLLASGPLFRRKLAQVLPGRRDVVHFETILSEIEIVTSKFLATATMINTGVGIATALALWAAGVPNPILWGGVAAVLNFVPYLGPTSPRAR